MQKQIQQNLCIKSRKTNQKYSRVFFFSIFFKQRYSFLFLLSIVDKAQEEDADSEEDDEEEYDQGNKILITIKILMLRCDFYIENLC